jgi:DNA replication protein DnaC
MIDHHRMSDLRKLKLGGCADTLDLRVNQAEKDKLSHLAFLTLVVQDEIERREAKKLTLRIQKASFEEEKTLEGFDFAFNPKIKRGVVTDLATCLFMEKREHLLIYGPAGVGKTHLAQAIGHEACGRGYSVLFIKAVRMLRHLFASRADQSWEKQVRKYIHPDLLIIDDFGLTALTPIQAEDIYEVVTERHLKSSIIVTNNRPPEDWVAL